MYLPRLLSPLSAFGDVSLLVVFPPTHESYSSGEKKISKLLNKSSLNAQVHFIMTSKLYLSLEH